MSAAVISEKSPPARLSKVGWSAVAVACVVFAHAPLWLFHASRLAAKAHYQFALLVPFIAGWLAWQRWSEFRIEPPAGRVAQVLPAAVALGFLAAATVVWSPWLGGIAVLVTGLALTFALGGTALLRQTASLWALLAFTIPLPLDADTQLVNRLRDGTTVLASEVLDQLGIVHLRSQNVIQLADQQLFVADACSGIHSLFVLLALGLAWAIWMRRPPVFTLVLLVLTFGLVVVENVGRLVTIATAEAWGNIGLAEGWTHGALGGVLFAVSCLLVASADQFLEFAWPRMAVVPPPVVRAGRPAPLSDTAFASPLVLAGFVVLGGMQLWVMPSPAGEVRKHVDPFQFADFGAATLPENLAGFERTGYRVERRVQDDPMGQTSQIWEFKRGDLSVLVSLDYPYFGLHDASDCYRGIGWTLVDSRVVDAEPGPIVEVQLTRKLSGEGWLIFSLADANGATSIRSKQQEVRSMGRRLADRIGSVLSKAPADGGSPPAEAGPAAAAPRAFNPAGPWYQIHLITRSATPFTPEQRQALRDLYLAARADLQARCRVELEGRR